MKYLSSTLKKCNSYSPNVISINNNYIKIRGDKLYTNQSSDVNPGSGISTINLAVGTLTIPQY